MPFFNAIYHFMGPLLDKYIGFVAGISSLWQNVLIIVLVIASIAIGGIQCYLRDEAEASHFILQFLRFAFDLFIGLYVISLFKDGAFVPGTAPTMTFNIAVVILIIYLVISVISLCFLSILNWLTNSLAFILAVVQLRQSNVSWFAFFAILVVSYLIGYGILRGMDGIGMAYSPKSSSSSTPTKIEVEEDIGEEIYKWINKFENRDGIKEFLTPLFDMELSTGYYVAAEDPLKYFARFNRKLVYREAWRKIVLDSHMKFQNPDNKDFLEDGTMGDVYNELTKACGGSPKKDRAKSLNKMERDLITKMKPEIERVMKERKPKEIEEDDVEKPLEDQVFCIMKEFIETAVTDPSNGDNFISQVMDAVTDEETIEEVLESYASEVRIFFFEDIVKETGIDKPDDLGFLENGTMGDVYRELVRACGGTPKEEHATELERLEQNYIEGARKAAYKMLSYPDDSQTVPSTAPHITPSSPENNRRAGEDREYKSGERPPAEKEETVYYCIKTAAEEITADRNAETSFEKMLFKAYSAGGRLEELVKKIAVLNRKTAFRAACKLPGGKVKELPDKSFIETGTLGDVYWHVGLACDFEPKEEHAAELDRIEQKYIKNGEMALRSHIEKELAPYQGDDPFSAWARSVFMDSKTILNQIWKPDEDLVRSEALLRIAMSSRFYLVAMNRIFTGYTEAIIRKDYKAPSCDAVFDFMGKVVDNDSCTFWEIMEAGEDKTVAVAAWLSFRGGFFKSDSEAERKEYKDWTELYERSSSFYDLVVRPAMSVWYEIEKNASSKERRAFLAKQSVKDRFAYSTLPMMVEKGMPSLGSEEFANKLLKVCSVISTMPQIEEAVYDGYNAYLRGQRIALRDDYWECWIEEELRRYEILSSYAEKIFTESQ